MKISSSKSIGLIISKHSSEPAAHAARLNDVLRSSSFNDTDFEIKIFSVNDATGSKLSRYIKIFKVVLEYRKTVDIIHFSYYPPSFIPLFLLSLKKPVVVGPNITGSAFPEKYLSMPAIKARSAEKKNHAFWRMISGRAFIDIMNTRICSKASAVITLSNYASDIISSRGIERHMLEVLPFAAPVSTAAPTVDLTWAADKKVVAYIGRLDKRKGFDLFLELSERIQSDVVFLVIGDGELRDELILKAKSNIRIVWLGKKSRTDLLSLIPYISIYFQPSTYEAIATTVLEALRSSVPVVSANIPSHMELERNGGIRFFECGDVEDAQRVLTAAIDEYEHLRKEALDSCERYSVDVPGEWLVSKYNALLKKS